MSAPTYTPADMEAAVKRALEVAAKRIVRHEMGTPMHSPPQLLTDAHDQICAIATDPAQIAAIVDTATRTP